MKVRLSKQDQVKILNSQDLFAVMQRVLQREHKIDRDKEHFWVIGLATNNTLLYVELISMGSSRATVVEPMDIYRWALQKDSKKLVLVHNHPGGSLQPSVPDVEVTAQLYQVGELLDLPVIDHLIITDSGFYSFLEQGLMAELAQSRKYLLNTAAQEKLKAEAEKVGEAKGLKAGEVKGRKAGLQEGREAEKLQVALAMKAKGIEAGVIAEVTGLSLAKVKGLKASVGKGPRAAGQLRKGPVGKPGRG